MLKSWLKTKEIEFLCQKEDFGVIPEPIPARKFLPEWFKKLEPKIGGENKLTNSTIKRCAPFLDAMTMGWIIPLAADIEMQTNDTGDGINYKWTFYKKMIENHGKDQLNPSTGPQHPSMPKPPMKFLNYWYIKCPAGYSLLFVPPLNRADQRFECIAGMVDSSYMSGDGEALEYINFPFFFKQTNYTGLIKAGTPLVQVIPIKLDDVSLSSNKANIRVITDDEDALVQKTRRKRSSQESFYRDKLWTRK